jgi:hypothetical protein
MSANDQQAALWVRQHATQILPDSDLVNTQATRTDAPTRVARAVRTTRTTAPTQATPVQVTPVQAACADASYTASAPVQAACADASYTASAPVQAACADASYTASAPVQAARTSYIPTPDERTRAEGIAFEFCTQFANERIVAFNEQRSGNYVFVARNVPAGVVRVLRNKVGHFCCSLDETATHADGTRDIKIQIADGRCDVDFFARCVLKYAIVGGNDLQKNLHQEERGFMVTCELDLALWVAVNKRLWPRNKEERRPFAEAFYNAKFGNGGFYPVIIKAQFAQNGIELTCTRVDPNHVSSSAQSQQTHRVHRSASPAVSHQLPQNIAAQQHSAMPFVQPQHQARGSPARRQQNIAAPFVQPQHQARGSPARRQQNIATPFAQPPQQQNIATPFAHLLQPRGYPMQHGSSPMHRGSSPMQRGSSPVQRAGHFQPHYGQPAMNGQMRGFVAPRRADHPVTEMAGMAAQPPQYGYPQYEY